MLIDVQPSYSPIIWNHYRQHGLTLASRIVQELCVDLITVFTNCNVIICLCITFTTTTCNKNHILFISFYHQDLIPSGFSIFHKIRNKTRNDFLKVWGGWFSLLVQGHWKKAQEYLFWNQNKMQTYMYATKSPKQRFNFLRFI